MTIKDDLLSRRWSSRDRVRAIPVAAAAAFAAPFVHRHSTLAQEVEIRITGWTSSQAENSLFSQIVIDLATAHPEIRVSYEPIPADYATKIQTDIAAGSVADVMYVDSLLAPDFMVNGALLELDSYMAADGVTAGDFYPGLISAFQWGGKTYGLPKDWSSLATVWDTQAATDAGIAAAPTTWDELKAAGQAFKDATGEARINIVADPARYLAFHYAGGAKVISDDGLSIVIDSPEAAIALDFYYGLYRDGLASTPADVGAGWPGEAIANDFADLVFEGNWVFPFLQENAPDLGVGIAELPAGPAGKGNLAFTVSFSAFAGTPNPEAAWTVINYLTGAEGMGKWTSLGLAMPSRVGLADAWLAQFPERRPFLDAGPYARGWQLGAGGQAFYGDATAELQGLFAGTQDVATTLANMQAAAEARLTLVPTGSTTPEASPVS